MSDRTGLNRIEGEPLEPRVSISGDSDADGVSDVEELLAGTDPNNPDDLPGPVLEAALPPLGAVVAEPIGGIALDPAVTVATATPGGDAIGTPVTTATVGGITLDVTPDHLGLDLDVGGLTRPSALTEAMGFGSTAGTAAAPASTSGGGSLGPLPGTGLFAADGETTTANADGTITTTKTATSENDKGVTTTTEETTEGGDSKTVTTTIHTEESDGDVVTIVKTDTYKPSADGSSWVKESGTVTATGTNNGQPFEWWRRTYPTGSEYDTGEGDAGLPEALSPIVQQLIATGGDPTTTTPSGPAVDEGGGDPVTAGDVAGATTVLGVRVNPAVLDGGLEAPVTGLGDPTTTLIVGGPETVDPHDPTLGGAGEPVSAGDLSGPLPTDANPTSSTSSAMRAEGYTGGEDEDLEDLELQFSTGDASTPAWTPVGEAGTVGTIHEVAEPATVDAPTLEAVLADPIVVVDPSGALPGLDPDVTVATALPGGLPVDAGIEATSIGDLGIDTAPSHYGIDTLVGGITPTTVTELVDVGPATPGIVSGVPGGTAGTGNLGPLPGTDLYSSSDEEGDGAVAGGTAPKPWVDPSKKTPEPEKGLLDSIKDLFDPAGGSTTPDAGTPATQPRPGTPLKPYPGQKYDDPDAAPVLAEPSDVVTHIVTTGLDPTTTTPSGPYVDDGAPEPVTSDDVAGAGPVGGLHVPLNPLIVDGGDEPDLVVGGDPGVAIVAEGPDSVDPYDPVLGGPGPIAADDLTPRPGGVANPIAGGEDEDLEDLEIQRLTPGPAPTTAFGETEITAQLSQPMTAATEPVSAPGGRGWAGDRWPGAGRGHGHEEAALPEMGEPVPEEPVVDAPVLDDTHGDLVEAFGDSGVEDADVDPSGDSADDPDDWDLTDG